VPKTQKPPVEFSEKYSELLDKVEDYVTENRLDNVISHIGEVSVPKEVGKLLGLFSKDILEDFLKEYSSDFYDLDKNEQKAFTKQLNQLSLRVIKVKYKMP